MKIPFHDPKRQYLVLREEIQHAIVEVCEQGRYLFGYKTEEFEQSFAQFCGSTHCISVANGTDALEIALRAVGCTVNSEVITVANAGCYTTTACRIIGAIPVYVDVLPKSLTLNIKAALEAVTDSTRAIVVTHLYGIAVDVPKLKAGLEKLGRQDIAIIEDCAQAHGAKLNGKSVGSMGDIGSFSFYPTKNLSAMGDGGALICHSQELADKLRKLRQYGWSGKYKSTIPLGRNSRLDEIQAAILLVKLPHLEQYNTRRRNIIGHYTAAAPEGLVILEQNSESQVGHLCVAMHSERAQVREQLHRAGIATDIHYPILDHNQPISNDLKSTVHDLRISIDTNKLIFSLPCFPELTDSEVDYVCEQLANLRA
jgi:dTDP-4-amino-4,6-dideoxygalactose transaminase